MVNRIKLVNRIKSSLVRPLCGVIHSCKLALRAKYGLAFLGSWSLVLPLMAVSSSRLNAQTPNQPLLPQPSVPLASASVPPALQKLLQEPQQAERVSATSPSQMGLTIPSLWWIEDQFGQKTVLDWKAYPSTNRQKQQVHVYLRSNLWTRFSYFERYAFVTHFGHLTRTYGYQLVMLEPNGSPLASYLCDFDQLNPQSIQGAQDSQQQPIQAYPLPTQSELACDLWLNPAFPRNVF